MFWQNDKTEAGHGGKRIDEAGFPYGTVRRRCCVWFPRLHFPSNRCFLHFAVRYKQALFGRCADKRAVTSNWSSTKNVSMVDELGSFTVKAADSSPPTLSRLHTKVVLVPSLMWLPMPLALPMRPQFRVSASIGPYDFTVWGSPPSLLSSQPVRAKAERHSKKRKITFGYS